MRAFFLINGIMNVPGCSSNWNGRGVTWINTTYPEVPFKAEKIEYFCSPILGRLFGQKGRAHKLYRTLARYNSSGCYNVVICHSNGADVVSTMFKDYPDFQHINELHIVSGATNANFNRNGFNRALKANLVDRIFVYVSGRDMALRLASWRISRMIGYGTLGLHGSRRVDPSVRHRVTDIKDGAWKTFGHSTCWDDDHFDGTMRRLVLA